MFSTWLLWKAPRQGTLPQALPPAAEARGREYLQQAFGVCRQGQAFAKFPSWTLAASALQDVEAHD